MPWIRYDDEFHHHDKVMQVRDADPGALALHLLANTWTASSKTPGWVPAYVVNQLVGSKGKRWAAILADARLWDASENDGQPGWWIHDYFDYNLTTDEIEERREKRREAGRIGGVRSGQSRRSKREANGEANGKQVASDSRSKGGSKPEAKTNPVPHNPLNSPTSTGSPTVPAGFVPQVIRAYVESAKDADMPAPEDSQAKVDRSARKLLGEGYELAIVIETARNAAVNGWTDLSTQMQRDAARTTGATNGTSKSTTDQRAGDALALADRLEREQKAIAG